MTSIKQLVKDIKNQQVSSTNKRVLLVEGPDDISALQNFLTQIHPGWEQQWVLSGAGSKQRVLQALSLEANWLGIVDRDAWTEDQVTEKCRNQANLLVLPRFCIESYLVVPEELWQGFPPKHQQKVDGGINTLIQHIYSVLPQWRNHAALWFVIQPLWEQLRAAGFNTAFREFTTAQNDAEVERCLRQWSQYLDPDALLERIQIRKAEMAMLSPTVQLTQCFHGKMFFEQVIDPLLKPFFGQRGREQRQKELFRALSVPDDLNFIWSRMGL